MCYVFLVDGLKISITLSFFYNHIYNFIYTTTYFNLLTALYLFLFLYCIWMIITTFSFRQKFIYFYLFLALLSVWGFCYSLEGLIFLLLLGELLIVLIFILFYLTLQFYTVPKILPNKLFLYLNCFVIYFLLYGNTKNFNLITFNFSYFSIGRVVSDDFFFFFFFFFNTFQWLVYFLGVILTLFSIFFIFFYLSCKNFNYTRATIKNKIYLLRKQNLLHQTTKKCTYTTFQR